MRLQTIQLKSTADLIENVKKELSDVGYKPGSIRVYQNYWDALLIYEAHNNISSYSPKVGLEFLDSMYGITVFTGLSKQDNFKR